MTLYRVGQGAGNSQDIVNSLRIDGKKAQEDPQGREGHQVRQGKGSEDSRRAQDRPRPQTPRCRRSLAASVRSDHFVAGFGSNGGEEFLSFLNISESLLIKGGKDWEDWDAKMVKGLEKAQDKDGSWQGHHCITGKTFCTAGALLVLMADRTPFPPEVLVKAETKSWFPWK